MIAVVILHFACFSLALPNGVSLESKWLQISSDLQDSSQYSGRYYDYFTLCELSTPGLANGVLLESKWQHISSDLRDISQYSSRYYNFFYALWVFHTSFG